MVWLGWEGDLGGEGTVVGWGEAGGSMAELEGRGEGLRKELSRMGNGERDMMRAVEGLVDRSGEDGCSWVGPERAARIGTALGPLCRACRSRMADMPAWRAGGP